MYNKGADFSRLKTFNNIYPVRIASEDTMFACLSYLPNQDLTQGQFFKRSLTGLNSQFSFS